MRPSLLLPLLLLGCLSLARLTAAWVPGDVIQHTPPDGDPNDEAHPMCLLKWIKFFNGVKLEQEFKDTTFHYTCTFPPDAGFTDVVQPWLQDPGSSSEVVFNGEVLNHRDHNTAISNLQDAPKSPEKFSKPLAFLPGENTLVIGVGCNLRRLPHPCYYQYTIKCRPDDGGFVVGDPQFVGLRGQQYQVHGVSGEIYNIVSDADLQYNSRFVFLDQGECPVVNGKKQKGCFSHPGSYLGEIGIKTRGGDRIHLQTGPAKQGFEAVMVNDRALDIDETILLADGLGSVSRNSTHLATVTAGNWEFAFENSDMFVNQRVRVVDRRRLRSHGLLGQTWRDATYPNSIKYIMGDVDDYVIRGGDIFGDSFVFNAFN